MANSNQLRKTHTKMRGANGIRSASGVSQEMSVKDAMYQLLETLRLAYSDCQFELRKTLSLQEVCAIQAQICSEFGVNQSNKRSHIRPDGGGLFVNPGDGIWHLILSCEAKRQGTNDKLKIEGKKKQAAGNAIERALKNYDVLCKYMALENYFPYAAFASGCDLMEGSSIRDRIASANNYSKYNERYVRNILPNTRNIQRASLFLREKHWTTSEILNVCTKITKESLGMVLSTYEQHNLAA